MLNHASSTLTSASRWRLHAILFTMLLLLATGATPQEAKLPGEKRVLLENTISKFMAANSIPGLAAAVVLNGEVAWSEGFGMADLENNVPVTPQTLFRLASVSKPITATAALQLWEQSKLDLDAPIQKYCPAFPQKEWPISTRLLLSHLGGIRHYRSDTLDDPEVSNTKHFEDPIAGGISLFANDPLIAKPGTKFNYSTHGCTLVGCAIEGASGEKYVDYVRQHILLPAAMADTRPDDRYAVIPHRTRFYSKSKTGAVLNADSIDTSYKLPGGGWLSSADDMARFEVAILGDHLLKRATRDLMWTSQHTEAAIAQEGKRAYALGWGEGEVAGLADVGHDGGLQGTSTFIMLVPQQRVGVVVLVNLDEVDVSALATDLMTTLLTGKGSAAR